LGNVTYPTRNFAQSTLDVSAGTGLYLGSTSVHLTGDASNLFKAPLGQVIATLAQEQRATKLLEVLSLTCLERMAHEEWDDLISEVLEFSDPIRHPISVIPSNDATAEEGLQTVEHFHVAFVLDHRELRQNLNSRGHLGMPRYTNVKAPFAIDEANDPFRIQFHCRTLNIKSLRIPFEDFHHRMAFPADCPRVRRIFTCEALGLTSTDRLFEEFPAYGSVLLRRRISP
jgi:hypothetical protein